jgi:hypothetical protein
VYSNDILPTSAEMAHVNTASRLASAFDQIPDLLLDADHRSVRDAALASLHAIGAVGSNPSILTVIGGGGSGKSSIVNALVGSDVATVSAVRPTTLAVAVIGQSNHATMDGLADFIYTDRLPGGVVVVDTPSWDLERDAVLDTTRIAHTVVVVLTPARYGDSVTSEIVRGLPDTAKVLIIANRMPADPAEHDDVLDDIETTFDRIVHVELVEGEPIEMPASLVADLPVDLDALNERRSREREAARLGRSIARSVSASAADLGDIQRAIAAATGMRRDRQTSCTIDDWPATRSALIELAEDTVSAFDDAVVERSDNDLSGRIRDDLSVLDEAAARSALDTWRADTAEGFRRSAEPRWRRNATLDLCERWSWMLSVDPMVRPPRRVSRAMRGTLAANISDARQHLLSVLDAGVVGRQAQWLDLVSRAGDYRPGELFAASDSLHGGQVDDD